MFCNAALVAIILNSGGLERLSVKTQTVQEEGAASSIVKTYLLVVLWSVAGLSAFKFVGAMWYLIERIVSLSVLVCWEKLLTFNSLRGNYTEDGLCNVNPYISIYLMFKT
jgi:hypothetical protein